MRQQWALPTGGALSTPVCAMSRQAGQAAGGATAAGRLSCRTHIENCRVEGTQCVVQVLLCLSAAEHICVLSMAPTWRHTERGHWCQGMGR